jgi:mono/diheme cytochrome c family protein
MRKAFVACAVTMLGWLVATASTGQDAGDPAAGRQLVLGVCAACHVVAADQPTAPKLQPPAPSFAEIANRPGTTTASVRQFLLTTHRTLRTPPQMPSMLLSDQEAGAAAAYIMTLRRQP